MSGTASAIQISDTRRLTSDPADQYNPVISGGYVVYTDTRAGNADIYLYNLASGGEVNITNDPANQLLNDVRGDFVVYSDYRTGVAQVWTYHIPTGLSCRLTYSPNPQVSPSVGGDLVVFQSMQGSESHVGYFDLSTLDPNDFQASCDSVQGQAVKTLPLGTGRQFMPRTSGTWVVYQESTSAGTRVFAFNRQTQTIVQAPEHQKNQLLPDIDGAHVAYIEDDGSNRDVVFYDLDTQTFVQITSDVARQNFPSISGNFIAFEDSRAGNLDIYLYDLTTGITAQLTSDPANQYLNSIDQHHVVFTDASAGNLDVVMITFTPETPPPDDPCKRQANEAPVAEIALDDEAAIVERQFVLWPFLGYSFTGGTHKHVSDHRRITYSVTVASDIPQAMIALHVQTARSNLPALLLAGGADDEGGIVLRVNGTERRWDDPNGPAGTFTIVAEKTYQPPAWKDGHHVFDQPTTFLLPPWVQVTAGRASNNRLLTLHAGDVTCSYRGRSKRYYFDSCDNGRFPGDAITASEVTLHVDDGDHGSGRTEVTAKLYAPSAAGNDEWVDVKLGAPVPLFAGTNTVVIEGPGYGSTYWKYRRIEFKGGGKLTAFSRPACVPDPTRLPACHDPQATVLAGPFTVVRHAGPVTTQTFDYDAQAPGSATLCVINGDGDGTQRVSAGLITHNGEPVLGPNAFGQDIVETSVGIIAHQKNTLGVELASAPGAFVTVKVVQAAPEPPTVDVGRGCSSLPNAGGGSILTLLLPLCALSLWRLFGSTRTRVRVRSRSSFRTR